MTLIYSTFKMTLKFYLVDEGGAYEVSKKVATEVLNIVPGYMRVDRLIFEVKEDLEFADRAEAYTVSLKFNLVVTHTEENVTTAEQVSNLFKIFTSAYDVEGELI